MKKLFSLCLLLVFTIGIIANDVIITRDEKRIEAQIIEVSTSEIKYRDADNLQGPIFVLATNDISTIIYANGKVQVFEKKETVSRPPISQQYEQSAYRRQPAISNNSTYQQPTYNNAVGLPIVKSDNFYIIGEERLTEDQYIQFHTA